MSKIASAPPRALLQRYAIAASVLNLLLLIGAVRSLADAATLINHDMARVLAFAVLGNVCGSVLLLWYATHQHWEARLKTVLTSDLVISVLPLVMKQFLNGQSGRKFHIFGLIYTLFLFLKLAQWLLYAAWNSPAGVIPRRATLFVFLAALITFAGFVPWIWLSIGPQGDEGHYLLLSHSLAFDHDFDLTNNYRNRDHLEMFPPPQPGAMRGYPYASMQHDNIVVYTQEPHYVINYRGQQMLEHDIGIPLLVLPGYALDLREGAMFTIALVSALGAAAIFQSALLLGAALPQALLAVGLLCFTGPYWVFTQCVLTDAVAAAISAGIALCFLLYRQRERGGYIFAAGFLVAVLPWLNTRFWPLAGPVFLVFAAWIIHRDWGRWGTLIYRLALLGVPGLVSLGAFAVIDKLLFNTYMPNAAMHIFGRTHQAFWLQPVRGFLGLFFDQSYGLLPTAPLYVAVAAGMVVLYRRDKWNFAVLLAPALAYVPFVSFSQWWYGGWSAPGRYVLAGVTAMVPAAALVLNRRTRWLTAALGAWSVFIAVLFAVNPYLRMPSIWVFYPKSMLVEFFHDRIRTPLYSILSVFPSFHVGRTPDYALGFLWLLILAATARWWARASQQPAPKP